MLRQDAEGAAAGVPGPLTDTQLSYYLGPHATSGLNALIAAVNAAAEPVLGMLPGSGEALAVRDSLRAGREMGAHLDQGRYSQAAIDAAYSSLAAAGALPLAGGLISAARRGLLPRGGEEALTRAEGLRRAGATPHEVWVGTQGRMDSPSGFYYGPDRLMRWEIPDTPDTGFSLSVRNAEPQYRDLAAVFHSPDAFRYVPELRNTRVRVAPSAGQGALGRYSPASPPARDTISIFDVRDPESVGMHELQHAVQAKTGLARGGDPGEFAQAARDYQALLDARATQEALAAGWRGVGAQDAVTLGRTLARSPHAADRLSVGIPPAHLTRALDELARQGYASDPWKMYSRLYGEQEARAVAERAFKDNGVLPPFANTQFSGPSIPLDQTALFRLFGVPEDTGGVLNSLGGRKR